jgi:hypothetical protein
MKRIKFQQHNKTNNITCLSIKLGGLIFLSDIKM